MNPAKIHRLLLRRRADRRAFLLRTTLSCAVRADKIPFQEDLRRRLRQRAKRKESLAQHFDIHPSHPARHSKGRACSRQRHSKIRLFRGQTRPFGLRHPRCPSRRTSLPYHRSFHHPGRFRLLRKIMNNFGRQSLNPNNSKTQHIQKRRASQGCSPFLIAMTLKEASVVVFVIIIVIVVFVTFEVG